jgi:pimeloyl-ACP methyl ester carboxylesterase
MAKKESPVFHKKINVPVTVVVGEQERPAFLSQAEFLREAWSCSKIIATGKHHFSVLDDFENERSELVNLLTKVKH